VPTQQQPGGRHGHERHAHERPARERQDRGLLLVRGDLGAVTPWAERGLVAVHAVPLTGWTAVLPAEPFSRVSSPYDEATPALAGRPLPSRLRPGVGLFVLRGRAVVTVQPPGWRPVQRWMVWTPEHGMVRTPRLPVARPADLMRAAGTTRQAGPALLHVLRQRHGGVLPWLLDVLRALGLPGERLLTGEHQAGGSAGAVLVEPRSASLARFEAILRDEAEKRAEMES
jgi:hypothetical protein